MTRDEAIRALTDLTHSWQPTAGSSTATLATARIAIAHALLRDQNEPLWHAGGLPPTDETPPPLTDIVGAVDDAATALLAGGEPAACWVRAVPIATYHDPAASPTWAAGRQRASVLGPFVDGSGIWYWLDSYEAAPHVPIFHVDGNAPFLLIPPEGRYEPDGIVLEAGTVWVDAQQFDGRAPPGFVGLRIGGGTLTFNGPFGAEGSGHRLEPQTGVRLSLELDTSIATGPPGTRLDIFSTVGIHIGPAGVEAVEMADGVLTLSGSTVELRRGAERWHYEPHLHALLVPMESNLDRLPADDVPATLWSLSGQAAIESGGWTLPVTESPDDVLGPGDGVGGIVLSLTPGAEARWPGLERPVALGRCFVELRPGQLVVISPSARAHRSVQRVAMWDDAAAGGSSVGGRSSVDVQFGRLTAVQLLSSADGGEAVLTSGTLLAHVDRPLFGDGQRIGFRAEDAVLRLFRDGTDRLEIVGARLPAHHVAAPPPNVVVSLALPNAVLSTTPAEAMVVTGGFDVDGGLVAGQLSFAFRVYRVHPTLSDPYAANLDLSSIDDFEAPAALVVSTTTWVTPEAPTLSLSSSGLRGVLPRVLERTSSDEIEEGARAIKWHFEQHLGIVDIDQVVLLDVSTHADQLGVGLGFQRPRWPDAPDLVIDELELATPGYNLGVIMLPQVAWEPVVTPPNPVAPSFPERLVSTDDGGPTIVAADVVALVPIAPTRIAGQLLAAIAGRELNGAVLLTLPFGIQATALLGRDDPAGTTLRTNRPVFGEMRGGRQFSVEAESRQVTDGRVISGAAFQRRNAVDSAGDPFSVLDNQASDQTGTTGDAFNSTFAVGGVRQGVPITRVDLSGYGQSCFSAWADDASAPPKITKVQFDVVVGRTAYEVVQEMSILWPWMAIVVRTITIERKSSGTVIRSDSGWVAVTPGVFRLPAFTGTFHPGVVKGLYEISDIREVLPGVSPPGAAGTAFGPVRFNAEAAIERVVAGHSSVRLDENGEEVQTVHAHGIGGYVQRLPLGDVLLPHQLAALFRHVGRIGGPIDCVIDVGGSGLEMRLSAIGADVVDSTNFAVAARGMPVLPRTGQWSMARLTSEDYNPDHSQAYPVDATGVPLVRSGSPDLASTSNSSPYRFAEPHDVLSTNPASDYGLLAASESFRVLFPRPRIDVDAGGVGRSRVDSGVRPLLADPYSAPGASSLFPKAMHCIPFPDGVGTTLEIGPEGHLHLPPTQFTIEPMRVRELVKTDDWRMTLEYADRPGGTLAAVDLTLDSTATPPATLTLGPVSTVADIGPFDDIFRIVGTIEAKSPFVLVGPAFQLGSALAPVQALITVLRDLALPLGLTGVLHEGGLWKQSLTVDLVNVVKKINPLAVDEDRINLGFCLFSGELSVGAFSNVHGSPHFGVFFEFEGEFQQLVFAGLYGGGYFRLELSTEIKEKEDAPGYFEEENKIELAAALCASFSPKIPGLANVHAGVRYGYLLEIDTGKGEIRPGVMLGMAVDCELLEGALGVGFEWEGRAWLFRDADPDREHIIHIEAEITAAATVTVAWTFEETIEIEADTKFTVDARVVAGIRAALALLGWVPL